jgi:peptidoglycan hydrolase-like protein with peptidoglycan-binding domain
LAQLDVRAVQRGLARLGYSPGPEDGVLGARTREAIRKFERDRDLPETGTITDELAQEITRVLSGGG